MKADKFHWTKWQDDERTSHVALHQLIDRAVSAGDLLARISIALPFLHAPGRSAWIAARQQLLGMSDVLPADLQGALDVRLVEWA